MELPGVTVLLIGYVLSLPRLYTALRELPWVTVLYILGEICSSFKFGAS